MARRSDQLIGGAQIGPRDKAAIMPVMAAAAVLICNCLVKWRLSHCVTKAFLKKGEAYPRTSTKLSKPKMCHAPLDRPWSVAIRFKFFLNLSSEFCHYELKFVSRQITNNPPIPYSWENAKLVCP